MRVMLRLALVLMFTVLVSACAVGALPPLARAADTEALVGRSPMAPLIAGGGGLALGAGILAGLGRRRRRRGDAGSAGWSVLADVPGQREASFSLAPVVDEPPAPQMEPDAALTEQDDEAADDPHAWSLDQAGDDAGDDDMDTPWPAAPPDDAVDDEATTSWLGQLAEQERDDAPLPAPSSDERTSGVPDTPWWIDETASGQAADHDELGAELLDDAVETSDRTAQFDPPRGPSDGR